VIETTALGAAFLAGLAVGYWASPAELTDAWQIDRRFEPAMGGDESAARRARWTKALQRARDWEEA
jgi:glycerol kinase